MSGRVGDLSPKQEEVLTLLRESLSGMLEPQHDDHLLLQFLRARRFDLQKTDAMFRRHLLFREQYPEDYMVNEYQPPELLMKHLLPPKLGYDKEGCPVRFVHVGHQDVKGLLKCINRPEIRKCVTWFLDTDKREMKLRSKETGVHIETRTFIFNLDGLSLRQIYHTELYDLAISFLKLYEYNYPENLKVAIAINAPSYCTWLFNMFKSFLTEDTIQKIHIFGYTGWKEELLKYVDADVLPVFYGGTRVDPDGDPKCPTLIREYIPIPKKYYIKNLYRLHMSDENVKKVMVGRRSKHSIPINVDIPGSSVCWEVECKTCDVHVYIVFAEGPTPEVVAEKTTVSHDRGVGKGALLAEKPGKYKLVLDNSYSYLRSKEILYKIYVSTRSAKNDAIPAANGNGECL